MYKFELKEKKKINTNRYFNDVDELYPKMLTIYLEEYELTVKSVDENEEEVIHLQEVEDKNVAETETTETIEITDKDTEKKVVKKATKNSKKTTETKEENEKKLAKRRRSRKTEKKEE